MHIIIFKIFIDQHYDNDSHDSIAGGKIKFNKEKFYTGFAINEQNIREPIFSGGQLLLTEKGTTAGAVAIAADDAVNHVLSYFTRESKVAIKYY